MFQLWFAVAILLCFSSVFIVWACFRPIPQSKALDSRNDAVIELFKLKQQELDEELAAAIINRSDYDQRLAEMQRTLLLETSEEPKQKVSSNNTGSVMLVSIALIVPFAGLLTYFELGAYGGLEQRVNLQNTRAISASATSLPMLIENLQSSLADEPNNPEGWYLLANSYLQVDDYKQGLKAFEQALTYVQEDSVQHAALLGQYAQALFFEAGQFNDTVNQAIAKALDKDPTDISALSLLGIKAFESQEYAAAINYWQRALPNAGEGQGKASLLAGIENAKQMLNGGQVVATGASISLNVAIANGLGLPSIPSATLFVYAKQGNEAMPLFAAKLDPADLPITLVLTDAMALQKGTRLADFESLNLSAHIALAGVPGQKPGDYVSQVLPVNLAQSKGEKLDLTIDQILK